jgi:hypothetical protein
MQLKKHAARYYCVIPIASSYYFEVQLMGTTHENPQFTPSQEEIDEESRRIRRLRILVRLTLETIASGDLSAEEASGMIAATRQAAMEMFPGKERAFDLIYRPQFQRIMHAVYRLQ